MAGLRATGDLDRLLFVRRHMAYVMPLSGWGLILTIEVSEALRLRDYLVGVDFLLWFGVFHLALRPLVRASLESTARWQGCHPGELEFGTGLRRLVGLTQNEPWWVTWSILACWTCLPVAAALTVAGLMIPPGFFGGDIRGPLGVMSAIRAGGVALAFLLAPLVRWLAGTGMVDEAAHTGRGEGLVD